MLLEQQLRILLLCTINHAPPHAPAPDDRSHATRLRLLRLAHIVVLLRDGQEQLELWRKLLLRVQAVGEVDAADPAVGVDLHTQRLDVVGSVRATGEVRQIELDLVPALVQPHRHGADERLDTRCGLLRDDTIQSCEERWDNSTG
jgi:hypothetical protein